MSEILALEHLYNRVSASFVASGIRAANVFGWRMPAQHPIGNRLAWVPGDASGNVGELRPAMYPGRRPRPLATLAELFTVYVYGHDDTDPENEQKQYHITRLLADAWYRAVYAAAHGNFRIKSQQWITTKLERRHGATLRLVCEVLAPVLDIQPSESLLTGADDVSRYVDAVAAARAQGTNVLAHIEAVLVDALSGATAGEGAPIVPGGDGT